MAKGGKDRSATDTINGGLCGLDTLEFFVPFDLYFTSFRCLEQARKRGEIISNGESFELFGIRGKLSENGVYFFGSIEKAITGQNLYFSTPENVYNKIAELGQTLQISPKKMYLRRYDFATTLKLQYKPQTYYSVLGNLPYYQRRQTYDKTPTLYYTKQKRKTTGFICQLAIYDKGNEIGANENIMRIELRLRPYRYPLPKVVDVIRSGEKLKNNLVEVFTSIKKSQTGAVVSESYKDAFNNVIKKITAAALEVDANIIETAFNESGLNLNRVNKSRLSAAKAELEKLIYTNSEGGELVTELETAVQNALSNGYNGG